MILLKKRGVPEGVQLSHDQVLVLEDKTFHGKFNVLINFKLVLSIL